MRPGIILQHGFERTIDTGIVRSDIVGFLGVIPRQRWPKNVGPGDFLELSLNSYPDLVNNPVQVLFDPVTRRAIQAFFMNGGKTCRLFGLVLESEQDLLVNDPFSTLFHGLIDRLRGQEDIGIICAPVLGYLPMEYGPGGEPIVLCEPVWEVLIKHCQEMNNRFLIIDPPRELHGPPLFSWVARFRKRMKATAAFGAVYYPWLMSGDEEMPPSGSVAGVYARVENEHAPFGVRWPPANEILVGITHPSVELRFSETAEFADGGINPILTQTARGVVIWGGRTLSEEERWKHINTRRIVSYISEQLHRDSGWAVFENNSHDLWMILERMVRSRLDQCWNGGLLTGDRAGSDYLVQCDSETNPPEVRDAGQVHVRVVVRPIGTTEYILVDLRLGAND